jgi:hypothetical protein
VNVPTGATTGFISVTTPQGTGTSAAKFLVDATAPTMAVATPVNNSAIKVLTGLGGSAVDNSGGSGIARVEAFLRRKNSSGVYEYWALRSGAWTWATTKVAIAAAISGTKWSIVNNNPAGMVLPSGASLPGGAYQLITYAYDKVGNSGGSSINFVVDALVPASVTLTAPAHNSVIQTLTTISGTATDNMGGSGIVRAEALLRRRNSSGVYEYWAKRNNVWAWEASRAAIAATLSGTTWSIGNNSPAGTTLPSGTTLPNGSYQVFAYAYDKAGNFTGSVTNTFSVVAGVAPVIVNQPETDGTTVTEAPVSTLVLSSVSAAARTGTVRLVFTGSLDGNTAVDPSRYRVEVDGTNVVIESVQLANGTTVVLGLEESGIKTGDNVAINYSIADSKGRAVEGEARVTVR